MTYKPFEKSGGMTRLSATVCVVAMVVASLYFTTKLFLSVLFLRLAPHHLSLVVMLTIVGYIEFRIWKIVQSLLGRGMTLAASVFSLPICSFMLVSMHIYPQFAELIPASIIVSVETGCAPSPYKVCVVDLAEEILGTSGIYVFAIVRIKLDQTNEFNSVQFLSDLNDALQRPNLRLSTYAASVARTYKIYGEYYLLEYDSA